MKKLALISFAIFINISSSYAAREDDLLEELNVLATEIINSIDCDVVLNRHDTFMNLYDEAKVYFDLREPEIFEESRRLDALKGAILFVEFERKQRSLEGLYINIANHLGNLYISKSDQILYNIKNDQAINNVKYDGLVTALTKGHNVYFNGANQNNFNNKREKKDPSCAQQ
ncbi:MAG: hypothetical protein Q8S31_00930 [Alphaproteobacteria bacterium]|nr:hypothetical protein [Alphaproteobacteria bacterium]